MRKLRLDVDTLAVESFNPQAERDPARGTVQRERHQRVHLPLSAAPWQPGAAA